MNAMPIFMYVDELLSGLWPHWCEDVLRNEGETSYRTARGFQEKQGTTGANERTRAKEAYLMGFLKGPVVNARGGGGGREIVPLGWDMSFGEGVMSRFGYACYALGKGLNASSEGRPISNTLINNALSVAAAIMLLQLGHNDGRGNEVLTVSLFRHILSSYPTPDGVPESKWLR